MSVAPSSTTMLAANVSAWCAEGTVADSIQISACPAPLAPQKNEILVGVKAASINVDDVAVCQVGGLGVDGWLLRVRACAWLCELLATRSCLSSLIALHHAHMHADTHAARPGCGQG